MASKDNLIDGIHHVQSTVPKDKHSLLKWNGWGYSDSKFVFNSKKKVIQFTGKRYPIGSSDLPHFTLWVVETFHLDLEKMRPPHPIPNNLPESHLNEEFYKKIKNQESIGSWSSSVEPLDRLVRCHGHTLHDIWNLREGTFTRIPDIVIWPENHQAVVNLIKLAVEYNVVLIPFGGGTSVSGAVNCPEEEKRSIAVVDTSQMNRILWIDRSNLICRCEAGIIGQDLERELQNLGFTVGHEPDSYEFSSLGGWVATRASGMKKNVYGNIEDLIVNVKMVTPVGVLQKNCDAPRISCGPDFNHVILGSEGTLGIITEVTLKIRPLPKVRKYGSIVFPDFESGVALMRDVAKERCQPASIRLMDNEQFKFGQSLRPTSGWLSSCMDSIKKRYLTSIKGLDLNQVCVATLLFEGSEEQVKAQESQIYSLASKHGGIAAGEQNGLRGYMLTFVIAYIRDVGLDYGVVAESFETSVPWDKALNLCKNVKHCIATSCKELGIRYFLISHRVTQTYDAGCCIYFYFGFNFVEIDEVENVYLLDKDPVTMFEFVEERARDEILRSGGSLSHHHGVGKIRKRWYKDQVTPLGQQLYLETKRALDPKGIFAVGNLVDHRFESKL